MVRFELWALSLAFCGHFFLLLLVWIWPMNACFRRQPKACAEFMHRPSLLEDSPSFFSIWQLTRPLSVIFPSRKAVGFLSEFEVFWCSHSYVCGSWLFWGQNYENWGIHSMLVTCSKFRILFKTYLLSVQNIHVVVRLFALFQFVGFFFWRGVCILSTVCRCYLKNSFF